VYSAADRITLLASAGVTVTLTPDGEHLDVTGPTVMVEAAERMLRLHRVELIAHLKRNLEPALQS
jgi:hypothetical protein